jgi:diaminohydroxyphosphoribosylaminopyrimidine deaminase/5-amino-6-(5-phosphoribosylamino)uracil reductase
MRWMEAALAEAARGLGRVSPNPAVGCVLVRGGREVGRGFHRRFGGPHAEVEALKAAGPRARGATAYVTLEPCRHEGKTGPCTEALIAAGVARVVAGVRDPNPAVAGKGLDYLRRRGVEAVVGPMRQQCSELIRGFRSWVTTGLPYVHLKLAASLDGRIAARGGASKWISGAASRRRVQEMRLRADAVLVGAGTVVADDPRLTCRLGPPTGPLRVVLDPHLATPPGARLLAAKGSSLLICSPAAKAARRRRLEQAGAEVLELDSRGRKGWGRLLSRLGRRGCLELLVEGGASVAASALRAGVVNAMTIFYNPRFIGGDGVPLVGPLGVTDPARAPRASTSSWEMLGEDLVWSGKPR